MNDTIRPSAVIGEAFRVARKRMGLSLADLAERAEVDKSLLAEIEAGEGQSTAPAMLLRLMGALYRGPDDRKGSE